MNKEQDEVMKKKTLQPFAPNLVESTRSIGYSFETALADIIDNSIGNHADRVDVNFRNGKDAFVAIIDNGDGMTEEFLIEAMRYGSANVLKERAEDDLGRFGLGMKMASMSQAKRLTVYSKKNGKAAGARWDLDYIYETQEWALQILDDELNYNEWLDLINGDSGTVVLWENLDNISETQLTFDSEFDETVERSSKHMALVFHRFFENPKSKTYFELYFNGRKIEPIDPFMKNSPTTQKLEQDVLFINEAKITVQPYVLPYISKLSAKERDEISKLSDLHLNQGLYIYRNKRLIVWGKWFRVATEHELKRLTRVQIDLPNNIDDSWKIDVKKSSASIPSGLRDRIRQIVNLASGKSERVYKYRGRKIMNDNKVHLWNRYDLRDGQAQYRVNREFPLIETLMETLDESQVGLLNAVLDGMESLFPYESVYYDMAKKNDEIIKNNLDDEVVYRNAKQFIDSAGSDIDKRNTNYMALLNTDYLAEYPDVRKMLEEELGK